jgi:hydrogenase maturation protein HypF
MIRGAASVPVRNERLRVVLRGAVQGVGFRPTVYRLSQKLHLARYLSNSSERSSEGQRLRMRGSPEQLDDFLRELKAAKPPATV